VKNRLVSRLYSIEITATLRAVENSTIPRTIIDTWLEIVWNSSVLASKWQAHLYSAWLLWLLDEYLVAVVGKPSAIVTVNIVDVGKVVGACFGRVVGVEQNQADNGPGPDNESADVFVPVAWT
jgi:hypothetical protein